jgi:hypothetical protein
VSARSHDHVVAWKEGAIVRLGVRTVVLPRSVYLLAVSCRGACGAKAGQPKHLVEGFEA